MGYSFNGTTKIITLTAGTTTLPVKDMYSRWKDWIQTTGSGYLQALSIVGGEPIDAGAGIYVTSYYFLENGWKIKPQEASHKLKVTEGVLVTSDGSDPFIQTTGSFNVMVQYSQPIKSETISTTGGGGVTLNDIESSTVLAKQDTLLQVLGLSLKNWKMTDQIYDSNKNLLTSTVQVYANTSDLVADQFPTLTLYWTATYDESGNCTSAEMKE